MVSRLHKSKAEVRLYDALQTLHHVLFPVIFPGLLIGRQDMELAIIIRSLIVSAPSKDACWVWGPKNRENRGANGRVFYDGQLLRARRVLIEFAIGKGWKYHHMKPVCGEKWCHNPFHVQIIDKKNKQPDWCKKTCHRGHDISIPENVYSYPSTGKRVCKLCRRYMQTISYKELRKKIKQEQRKNEPIL